MRRPHGHSPSAAGAVRQDFPARRSVPDRRGGRRPRAAPAWVALASPVHSAPETLVAGGLASDGRSHTHRAPRPGDQCPGRQLSSGSRTGAQAGDVGAQLSFKTPTRRTKGPQLGAARSGTRQPPPTARLTGTSSWALSQHATHTRWTQPPLQPARRRVGGGPGDSGLAERPRLGRGARHARVRHLAGCWPSGRPSASPRKDTARAAHSQPHQQRRHADIQAGERQPPPVQASRRTTSRGSSSAFGPSQFPGMRIWPLVPGQ